MIYLNPVGIGYVSHAYVGGLRVQTQHLWARKMINTFAYLYALTIVESIVSTGPLNINGEEPLSWKKNLDSLKYK